VVQRSAGRCWLPQRFRPHANVSSPRSCGPRLKNNFGNNHAWVFQDSQRSGRQRPNPDPRARPHLRSQSHTRHYAVSRGVRSTKKKGFPDNLRLDSAGPAGTRGMNYVWVKSDHQGSFQGVRSWPSILVLPATRSPTRQMTASAWSSPDAPPLCHV
jgi:hypothetical protein